MNKFLSTKKFSDLGAKFLKEGLTVEVMFDGSDPVGAELPFNVELKVVETVPGVRGRHGKPGHEAGQSGNRCDGQCSSFYQRRRSDSRRYPHGSIS